MEAPRGLWCAVARVKGGWLYYLINNGNDVQGKRQTGGEMMKVCERPYALGRVVLQAREGGRVEAIYGPRPDRVEAGEEGWRPSTGTFRIMWCCWCGEP